MKLFLPEEKIIEGCLQNNRTAQKALYDLYKTKMYTLACRITNNHDDAGDALQEGFLYVFENLHSFKKESRLGTWIHTIVARTALKKIKNRINFESVDELTNDEKIDWGEEIDVQAMEKAIRELPDGYRSIFTLYEIEGFSHSEIAGMMEISISTSKSQLHKAKKALIQKLNAQ